MDTIRVDIIVGVCPIQALAYFHYCRARDMEGKHEEFWRQGDFGYVKKEVDSMMTLCKPQAKVSPLH